LFSGIDKGSWSLSLNTGLRVGIADENPSAHMRHICHYYDLWLFSKKKWNL